MTKVSERFYLIALPTPPHHRDLNGQEYYFSAKAGIIGAKKINVKAIKLRVL
jgi:hypothetical protein